MWKGVQEEIRPHRVMYRIAVVLQWFYRKKEGCEWYPSWSAVRVWYSRIERDWGDRRRVVLKWKAVLRNEPTLKKELTDYLIPIKMPTGNTEEAILVRYLYRWMVEDVLGQLPPPKKQRVQLTSMGISSKFRNYVSLRDSKVLMSNIPTGLLGTEPCKVSKASEKKDLQEKALKDSKLLASTTARKANSEEAKSVPKHNNPLKKIIIQELKPAENTVNISTEKGHHVSFDLTEPAEAVISASAETVEKKDANYEEDFEEDRPSSPSPSEEIQDMYEYENDDFDEESPLKPAESQQEETYAADDFEEDIEKT